MKIKTLTALLLLMALLLTGCSLFSDPADTTGTDTSNDIPDAPREILLAVGSAPKFEIVIPQNCDTTVQSAATRLRNKLNTVTGILFQLSDDITRNNEIVDSEGEIVIGNCKRTEVRDTLSQLKFRDYTVKATDSSILVTAYEDNKITDALNDFIDWIGEDGHIVKKGKEIYLIWNEDIYSTYEGGYPLEGLSLNGVSISKYRIVYPSDADESEYLKHAESVRQTIGKRSGEVLEICSDAKAPQKYEILLGKTNRSESVEAYEGSNPLQKLDYAIRVANGKLLLLGGSYTILTVTTEFDTQLVNLKSPKLETVFPKEFSLVLEELPTKATNADYRIMTYNILADIYVQNVHQQGAQSAKRIPESTDVRSELVAGLLERLAPDVCALQEVTQTWKTSLSPLIEDNYGWVASLPANPAVSMIYNKNTLKLIKGQTHKVDNVGTIVTWGIFENKENGEKFMAMVIHLNPFQQSTRIIEGENLGKYTKELHDQYGLPIMVMGDINSRVGDEEQSVFMQKSGLTMLSDTYNVNPLCVDHIFGNSTIDVISSGMNMRNGAQYASDHHPAWIDIKLAK